MADLIVRPSGLPKPKEYALQLRYACCGETAYDTVCYISEQEAREIVDAGKPYWLFGDPVLERRGG